MIEDETENGGLLGTEQLMWWWWPWMLGAHLLCSEGQCVWKKGVFWPGNVWLLDGAVSSCNRHHFSPIFVFFCCAEFVWWHPRCAMLGGGKMECRPECLLLVLPDPLSTVSARRWM